MWMENMYPSEGLQRSRTQILRKGLAFKKTVTLMDNQGILQSVVQLWELMVTDKLYRIRSIGPIDKTKLKLGLMESKDLGCPCHKERFMPRLRVRT